MPRKNLKSPKKTSENANNNTNNNANKPEPTMYVTELDNEDDITSLAEGLDREEQELADDEDEEMNENVAADLEIEEVMKEVLEVAKKVKSIQRVLFKVCLNSLTFLFMRFYNYYSLFSMYLCLGFFYYQLQKLAYAIKRSTMILLPWLKEILEELATIAINTKKKLLSVRIMPRDVSTCWNSTYDMLKFAYSYHEAIDRITGDRAMKLRDYELLESEWETVKQLRDSLKASIHLNHFHNCSTNLTI